MIRRMKQIVGFFIPSVFLIWMEILMAQEMTQASSDSVIHYKTAGDTSAAIIILDSALIPPFAIYPGTSWGKSAYIDTSTFGKLGLIIFFDPYDSLCRKYVEIVSSLKSKLEDDWKVYLIACRKMLASARQYESKGRVRWKYRIFMMPDFLGEHNSADSLKKALDDLSLAFPVYRLKNPLGFDYPGCYTFPAELWINRRYVVATGLQCKGDPVNKKLQEITYSLASKYLKKWKYESKKGGDIK